MAIDPVTGYQIAKKLPIVGEPIGNLVGGLTNLMKSGVEKMPFGEEIIDLLPGDKKREYLSIIKNYTGDPDSALQMLEQARMNGSIDSDTYKQATVLLKIKKQNNNDMPSQGRQNIDTAKKSLEMAMESALNQGNINQYSELSEEYKKYSGLNTGLNMIPKFDMGGDVSGYDGMDTFFRPNSRYKQMGEYNMLMPAGTPPQMATVNQPQMPAGTPIQSAMANFNQQLPQRVAPYNPMNTGAGQAPPAGFTQPTVTTPVAQAPSPVAQAPSHVGATYTGAGTAPMPYASGITSIATGLDPTTKQMLFGLDGQGGFIPGAMQAAESTFFNPDGTPRVVDQTVAGLTDDQKQAMEMARSNVGALDPYIGEASGLFRDTTGGFDRSQIDKFNDPFEDKVVQQAIEDMRKYGAQEDISDTASAIRSGGLSAFGERAGKFAGEKAAGRERGMLEAIAGIRSGGFDRARTLAMTEQARMNEAKRQAASGLLGIGGIEQRGGAFDINQLLGSGGLQQTQSQAQADAIRANAMARQQAPLAQYQALAPLISMAPAGTYQTQTQYAPKPSPLQAGLGTGLSAFGAIGNLLNPKTT